MERFTAGELDAVYVVYAQFNSALSHAADHAAGAAGADARGGRAASAQVDYILEPGADEILGQVLPLYVRNAVYRALVETDAPPSTAPAHGHEERHRQRRRHARKPYAHLQPGAPGRDHAGDRRDRRRRRGARIS